jgi:hypothetical protein
MDSILGSLRKEMSEAEISPQTVESRDWFFEKVSELAKTPIDRKSMMTEPPLKVSARQMAGKMYMFYYKPLGINELPYYDRFPLIFMLEKTRNGFLGFNLHYLPYDLRQEFFYGLVNRRASNRKFTAGTFIRMDYNYIKSTRSLRAYKACIKKYNGSGIQGKIVNVPAQEWERAIHLPTALFKKKPESAVWRDSRKLARSTA